MQVGGIFNQRCQQLARNGTVAGEEDAVERIEWREQLAAR
jgi:hypothetical protein